MSSVGVRRQNSIVNIQSLHGYSNPIRNEKFCQEQKSKPIRYCSHEECTVRLSIYNKGDFCAQHERGKISHSKLI